MQKLFIYFSIFLIGVLSGGAVLYLSIPGLMIHEVRSPLSFDMTVNKIVSNVEQEGQVVPKIYDFRAALKKHVGQDVGDVKVIEICYPEHAAELLSVPDNKIVTPFMPCAVGVYTKEDGATYVATLNVDLRAKMLGKQVYQPMSKVALKDAEVLSFLHEN